MTNWVDNLLYLDQTDSTNTFAKRWGREENPVEGSAVYTEFQTGGRGQKGNSWFSSPNKNILFSLVIYPNFINAKNQFLISKIAALSLKNVLSKYTQDIRIKWPNDIFWKDCKIAGILIENDLVDTKIQQSVIGMGININEETFPDHLPNPVSLYQICGETFDTKKIICQIIEEYQYLYENAKKGVVDKINADYMQDLYHADNYYEYIDSEGRFKAKIADVLPSGQLILERENGENKAYAFKQVQFVIK